MQIPVFIIVISAVILILLFQGLTIIIIKRFIAKEQKSNIEVFESLLDDANCQVNFSIREVKHEMESIKSVLLRGAENKANSEKHNPPAAAVVPVQEKEKPFHFLRHSDPAHFLDIIQQEHPQTIALVLSHLEPAKASVILQNLPCEMQSDVLQRIACMDNVSPKIIRAVENVLEQYLVSCSDFYHSGGVEKAVEIINLVDRSSEKKIIEELENNDPELAEELKKNMFVFEDIVMLNNRDIQKVMREVDSQELAKALKSVDSSVHELIFRNMSKRAAAMLKEDMDYMGPVRLKDVEEAQQKIISIIRYLEDTGEIYFARAGEDEIVV